MKHVHERAAVEPAGRTVLGRRDFVKLGVIGAGFSILYASAPVQADGSIEALLLSCMDYRLVDDLVKYMDGRGLTNKYDHVVLAGASVGACHEKFAAWHETFWSHLQLAVDLHKIKRVIIMDHRDCAAFKLAVGEEALKDANAELAIHAAILVPFAKTIRKKYPALEVETMLMALDGTVMDANIS